MQTVGSSGVTSHEAEPEFDVHPALRGNSALWNVLSLIVLGSLFLLILVKDWKTFLLLPFGGWGFRFFGRS